jgi:fibronectin type 3 domain-containing protein
VQITQGRLYLNWTQPKENLDGSRPVDLVRFAVLRKEARGGCIECPSAFEVRAQFELALDEGYQREGRRLRWRDDNLHPESTYVYQVMGYNHWGYPGPASNHVTVTWKQPPPIPILKGTGADSAAELTWNPVPAADGYRIYRRRKGMLVSSVPVHAGIINETRYRDIGLQNGVNYCYVVRAVVIADETVVEGPSSNEISVRPADKTPPQPPAGLLALPHEDGVELTWFSNQESDLLGYYVYRWREDARHPERITAQPLVAPLYLDTNVEHGTSYHYAVTAVDNSPQHNESPLSSPTSITYRRFL